MGTAHRPRLLGAAFAAGLLAAAGCDRVESMLGESEADDEQVALYQTASVMRRDITVAVDAAGIIEPVTTVEVKSKASGEILAPAGRYRRQRGRRHLAGAHRPPRAQQLAALGEGESGRRQGAPDQRRVVAGAGHPAVRAGVALQGRLEQSTLEHATARSDVVRGEIQVENAEIQLEDSDVVSPIAGTVIERLVEQGQVISSPMGDVGGGTLLMKMADLSHVQVRMLVDEVDIGKIQPGERAAVNVAAHQNRPFEGVVVKVEPQAVAEQNVTMFPVLIDIENRQRLLKPGMNAEVEVIIAQRADVPAIPNAALRTEEDIFAAGSVLGLERGDVEGMLEAAPTPPARQGRTARQAPPGGDRERMRAIFMKMRSGETLSEEEAAACPGDAAPARCQRRGTARPRPELRRRGPARRRLPGLRAAQGQPGGLAHPHRRDGHGPRRGGVRARRRRRSAAAAERLAGARPGELPETHQRPHGDSRLESAVRRRSRLRIRGPAPPCRSPKPCASPSSRSSPICFGPA